LQIKHHSAVKIHNSWLGTPNIDDFFSEQFGPSWTVTELFIYFVCQ